MRSSVHSRSRSAGEQGSSSTRTVSSMADPWARMAGTWGSEALRLAGRSLEHSRSAAEQLGRSRSWQEAVAVQVRWAQQVMGECMETGRQFLTGITEAAGTVQSAAKRGMEETDETAGSVMREAEKETGTDQAPRRRSAALRVRRHRR